ncbi:hypothetical protein K438DRAFT_1984293 [Mycena galopus ATCC 62051]|nr:hypothetical protein K438DRAFT_1984293 [Mycena galopus ATCC 62051]
MARTARAATTTTKAKGAAAITAAESTEKGTVTTTGAYPMLMRDKIKWALQRAGYAEEEQQLALLPPSPGPELFPLVFPATDSGSSDSLSSSMDSDSDDDTDSTTDTSTTADGWSVFLGNSGDADGKMPELLPAGFPDSDDEEEDDSESHSESSTTSESTSGRSADQWDWDSVPMDIGGGSAPPSNNPLCWVQLTLAEMQVQLYEMRAISKTWARYVAPLLKQVHPDTGIPNKAMSILNSFVNDIFERIASEAYKLTQYSKPTCAPQCPLYCRCRSSHRAPPETRTSPAPRPCPRQPPSPAPLLMHATASYSPPRCCCCSSIPSLSAPSTPSSPCVVLAFTSDTCARWWSNAHCGTSFTSAKPPSASQPSMLSCALYADICGSSAIPVVGEWWLWLDPEADERGKCENDEASFLAAALTCDVLRCAPPTITRPRPRCRLGPAHPLRRTPVLTELRGSSVYGAYVPLLERTVLSRPMNQLREVVRIAFVMELVAPLSEAASTTEKNPVTPSTLRQSEAVKSYVMGCARYGELAVRVDHADSIASVDQPFSDVLDDGRDGTIQPSVTELVRTRLGSVARCLHHALEATESSLRSSSISSRAKPTFHRVLVLPALPLSPTSLLANAFRLSLIFALRPAPAALITTATHSSSSRPTHPGSSLLRIILSSSTESFMRHVLTKMKDTRGNLFRQELCISPHTFDRLVDRISDDAVLTNDSRKGQMPIEDQLAITLFRFGHSGNAAGLQKITNWAGIRKGTVTLVTRRVMTAVLRDDFMKEAMPMPTPSEKERAKAWVEAHS